MVPAVIPRLLLWLDASPARYGACAWAAFAAMAAAAALPLALGRRRTAWLHPLLFWATVALCAVAFRWPSLLDNQELQDPDESQMMAAAITLRHDPLFYRSVDGGTCGPVDEAPLAAIAALGMRIDYRVAHAAALLLSLAGVLATGLTLRRLFGDAVARLALLPLAASVAFCDFNQLLHYSTEQCPAALVAIACGCLACAWDAGGRLAGPGWLAGCGLALGAVPFAKLQGTPVALCVAAGAAVLLGATPAGSPRGRLRAAGLLAAGALAVPAALLAATAAWGQWGEFSRGYILDNLHYASGRSFSWADSAGHLLRMVRVAPGCAGFVLPGAAFVAVAVIGVRAAPASWPRRYALFSVVLLFASALAVVAPGRDFFHYLHFLLLPLALAMGCCLGVCWGAPGAGRPAGTRSWALPALALMYAGACVGFQVAWRARAPEPYAGLYASGRGVLSVSAPAREILRHAGAGDSLAIWGWAPRLWVETGLWQGTRDGNTIRQSEPGALQGSYQERYLRDLRRNRPAVFVDAVGEGNFLASRPGYAHERFPAIDAYIGAEYRFVREVEGMRVYVRRARP